MTPLALTEELFGGSVKTIPINNQLQPMSHRNAQARSTARHAVRSAATVVIWNDWTTFPTMMPDGLPRFVHRAGAHMLGAFCNFDEILTGKSPLLATDPQPLHSSVPLCS